MPLTKYQIRNEYSLADPELYRAADKDDPEALLEGVAMAGLVGVLRQLGDLAEFAAGIFHDLHEEVMATAARGHGLMIRIQQLEAEVAPIEKAFLSRTSHSLFIYNAGVDWHPNLRTDQIMITRGDLPRFVRDSYEECRGPPRLFLLDKFDIAGAGACLKRYSDPSFFKAQLNFSETTKAEFQKEKKTRIVKKKGSRCRNGEKPDVFPTSHAKLHQLFSEERRQNEKNVFMPHVKLKKRQSNGSLFDSTTGKSYMERFLETHSPERKIAYESSLGPLNLNMKSNNSSELGLEIREISTGSPVNKLLQRERGADSSFNRQEAVLESSMYDLYEDAIKEGILENFPESITFIEVEKNPSSFYKAGDQKESMVDLEIKTQAIADGYQSDDINSEVDNYLDALTTMESEMETDTDIRPKYERGFFNTERQGLDSDANEEHQMLQAQFSGTHFIESSSASDDGNNVFKKGRSSFSYSNTLSNLDENPPSDGDGVAKVCTSTETCPSEFIDKFSKELSRDGDALVTESLEYVVPCSSFNEVSENPSYRSELVESSSSSCVTDSSSTLPHLSQGANLNGFELLGPESIEISSDCPKFDLEGSSSNTDADGKNLFGDLPCTTSVSDFSFQMTDYLPPMQFAKGQPVEEMDGRTGEVSSDALWQLSNISDVALEKKYVAKTLDVVSSTECAENGSTETLMNGKLELPHSVTLPTEKQLSVLAGQDLEACSGTTQPECLHGSISPGDLNDGNPDKIVSKTDTSIRTTGANSEYLTSVLDILDTSDFTEQDFLEMKDEVLPPDLKLENGNGCSGVKALDNNLDVLSNTFESGVKDELEIDVVQMNSCASVGKAAVPLEFPSICVVSGSPKPATATDFHSQLNNLVNGTVHLEADNDITMCPNLIVGPSGKHMTLQEECPSSNRDLGDLVAEDHSQSDNLVTGIVHAEACGDDTSVCPNLIGSPSKNHVKVLEECPSNLDLGNLLTEANSQLENLVTGTVDAEADGADTADYPNLNCDLSGNHIKLQEECPSSGDSAKYKREIFEACSPKCIIESESRKETNQLAVASTELNFELCNPEFFDPSSSELSNDVHNSLLVEHVQNDFHLMDVTRTSTSLKESDQELKSAHHSYLSESADNSNLSATRSLQEPGVLSEQTLKSEADQLIVGSLHEDGGSFMPFNLRYEPAESLNRRVEDGCVSAPSELSWVISLKEPSEPQFSSTTANHKIDSSETAIDCSDLIVSSIGTYPGTKQPAEPPPSRSVLDLPLPDPEAGQANLEMPPLPPLPPMQWRRIGQLLRQGSLASEGEMVQPSLNPFSPQLAATAHEKAQQGFPTLVGEIAQPLNLFLPLSSLEDKKSQHGSEALRGEMVQAGLNPFSSQLPVMVDDANSQQGSKTSEGKRIHPPKPNPILPSPALEDENPQHGSLTSGGEMGQFASLPTIEDTRLAFSLHGQLDEVQNPLASKSITEDGMLQHTSLTKEGVEWPLNSFAPPPTSKDEKPPHGSLTLEGEMVWPSKESALLPTVEVGMPNGNLAKKLPRPRDPLIEAVASHDKSMLRKVTERVQSLSGPKVDERDSLLEQIRAKSFNLKPAATTRPSLHGPKTNLKVAAILEKANAIRQALTGSDEDDDGDSWSDS